MTVKPLLVVLLLALAGCGAAPTTPVPPEAQPKQAQKTQPRAGRSRPLPPHYRKVKIVEAAKHEWVYFGRQKVVINGEEESIPHVGIWESAIPFRKPL